MNITLILSELQEQEKAKLATEFPGLLFLSYPRHPIQRIPDAQWQRTEIIYGERLTPEELALCPQLRWIHSPTSNLNRLCLKEIEERGNILVTFTKNEQRFQIAEFVFAAILAFAKNLYQWKEVNRFPNLVWDCKWRGKMETLENKLLLQIGMGSIGQAIAERAAGSGMRVFGVDETASFKPHCAQVFSYKDLDPILPEADVISVCLPREQGLKISFQNGQLSKIKDNAILSFLGSPRIVDESALLLHSPRFRGILLDAYYQTPIPPHSQLWKIPNLLVTPEVSPRPRSSGKEAFTTFRYNLRQYTKDNYGDMKNLVDPQVAYIPEEDIS